MVLILDALDEAADPAAVVRDLILPLTGADGSRLAPDCRVMVGTRPWWGMLHALHTYASARPGALLELDPATDEDRAVLADDLAAYLGLLLDEHYPDTTPRVIAHRLAHESGTGAFLIAALYADHLIQQAAAACPLSDEQIFTGLPCDITEVYDLHTMSLAASQPWVLPVLGVLGQAQGQGMPLELLHEAALSLSREDHGARLPPRSRTRTRLC